MTALYVVLVLVVLSGLAVATSYNRFVRQRNLVQESWRQVDVELHRRHELIPNLVETVKGYAAHERATFDAVTSARAAALTPGSSPAEQAAQEQVLGGALRGLLAVAEAYPQLRASENFLALQQQLGETEDRIAAARRFYNGNVRGLNTRVEAFPSAFVASLMHQDKAEYFELTDAAARVAPQVSFGAGGQPLDQAVAAPAVVTPAVVAPPTAPVLPAAPLPPSAGPQEAGPAA